MVNKRNTIFWFKTGIEISPDDRVYYNVSVRNGNNLISSYDYWHSDLFIARNQAISKYKNIAAQSKLTAPEELLTEMAALQNLKSSFEK